MSPRFSPLRLDFRPCAAPAPREGHPLATLVYGERASSVSGGAAVAVPLDPLDPEPLAEVWTTDRPARLGEELGFETAETDELLFGSTEVAGEDPEGAARETYARLFRLLDERGFPHLLRVWNVLPHIGRPGADEASGIDRYMQFCRGRALAFEDRHGEGFEALLPAASAVGSARGPFLVWFLAARRSGVPRENPRQVSAFRYPERYGPKPPSFARATLAPPALGSPLLLSGTASILGCESVHADDTAEQLRVTMENLRALVDPVEEGAAEHFSRLKVFVRDLEDLDAIREHLAPLRERGTELMFVRADICRPELRLEIEGLARPAAAPASVSR